MNFNNKFNFEWGSNDGTEPSDQLKASGFTGGYKPPAGVFNWFFRKFMKGQTELQEAVNTVEANIPTKTSDLTNDSNFVTGEELPEGVQVVDNLTSTLTNSALSANQGRVLKSEVDGKAAASHSHATATTTAAGFMSASDRSKLDGIATGATKVTVDSSLSDTSTNPVQNKVINTALDGKVDKVDGKALSTNDYTTAEKTKLAGIATGANAYTHPSYTAKSSGLYKVTVDSTGHVSGATAVTKSDITALGIPEQDTNTTYSNASTSAAGLMSAADKTKLDGIATGATKVTVENSLTSTSTTNALSAYQGNVLNKKAGHSTYGESTTLYSGTTSQTVVCGENAEIFNDYRTRTYSSDKTATAGNVASGIYSHAEGFATTASGKYSHAEGYKTVASEREAHAEGSMTTASGQQSHAEGYGTTASGDFSHAGGYSTTASGSVSHAEGYKTVASNHYSHAGGNEATASGNASFAHGYQCEAQGAVSTAFGEKTIANGYQFVCGQMNTEAGDVSVGSQSADASIFIIGNGTSSTRSNAFRTTADGQSRGLKSFMSSGADFPEYFEWLDGNPNNEDRRGKFVTLDGKKIRLANGNDDYIVGVVSVRGGFIGNTASECWQGQYLKDVFGEWLTEQVEIPEKTDEKTGEITPAHTVTRYVVNPDYDPEQEYISREFRKEWSPVGLLGQVIVVDDGTCQVNGYCKPSTDGIATAAESGYRVMERIDDTHIEVLIK